MSHHLEGTNFSKEELPTRTWHHIPDDSNLGSKYHENLKKLMHSKLITVNLTLKYNLLF